MMRYAALGSLLVVTALGATACSTPNAPADSAAPAASGVGAPPRDGHRGDRHDLPNTPGSDGLHGQHRGLPLADRRSAATAAERDAADALLNATRESLVQFADEAAARMAGFVPAPGGRRVIHYRNSANRRDGQALDPVRPEGLVYARTAAGGYRLLGAVFTVARGESAPTPGGGIFQWHTHDPSCGSFLVAPRACETTFRMLHVWTNPLVVDPWAQHLRDAIGRDSRIPEG